MLENERQKTNQFLTLNIAGDLYAIAVTDIREVLTVPEITRIPRMPEFMRGVFNLRGSVVPILDLKCKFGLGNTIIGQHTAIIVVELPYEETPGQEEILHLGIFADSVQKVVSIESSNIEAVPKIGTRINTTFIFGMGHLDDTFCLILNIPRILTAEDVSIVNNVQVEIK